MINVSAAHDSLDLTDRIAGHLILGSRLEAVVVWDQEGTGTAKLSSGDGYAMTTDLLEMYRRASEWTLRKVAGAGAQLNVATPCDDWAVRDLLSHMLETQQYFVASAQGREASPPSPTPTFVLGDDPAADFEQAIADMLRTFGDLGVIGKTGSSLGIAFSDQLLHGWDVARATGQDEEMPAGLAEAAYETIHGQFSDEQRKGIFKPEVTVDATATAQEKLLAYTGRKS